MREIGVSENQRAGKQDSRELAANQGFGGKTEKGKNVRG
jgi:hypothetical protein